MGKASFNRSLEFVLGSYPQMERTSLPSSDSRSPSAPFADDPLPQPKSSKQYHEIRWRPSSRKPNAAQGQIPIRTGLTCTGSESLGMDRTDVAKILLFNEAMDCILLQRDDALAPISGPIYRHGSIFEEVQRIMTPITGIEPQHQPSWWHIRTESFPSSNTYMHILFGKVSQSEMFKIERRNRLQLILVGLREIQLGTKIVAHRLKYLIPMAVVLSSIDSRHWPKP